MSAQVSTDASRETSNRILGAIASDLSGRALDDELEHGWSVCGCGASHHPTVSGGEAFVLYLLAEGAIECTRG